MKNTYEKPIVKLNDSTAEGVYAASGNGRATCGSNYMSVSTYFIGNGSGTTYKEFYGCAGCPNSNRKGTCALTPGGEYDDVVASNNGNYSVVEGYDGKMPRWEAAGNAGNDPVTNTNLWN